MPTGRMSRGKRLMGFEPTTFCMASRRSSQLSYSRAREQYRRGPGMANCVLPPHFWVQSLSLG